MWFYFVVCVGETTEGKDNSRYLQETRKGNKLLQVLQRILVWRTGRFLSGWKPDALLVFVKLTCLSYLNHFVPSGTRIRQQQALAIYPYFVQRVVPRLIWVLPDWAQLRRLFICSFVFGRLAGFLLSGGVHRRTTWGIQAWSTLSRWPCHRIQAFQLAILLYRNLEKAN